MLEESAREIIKVAHARDVLLSDDLISFDNGLCR